jgi:hypothetical protein
MIMSIRRGQPPRVPPVIVGAESDPGFSGRRVGLWRAGRAVLALAVAAILLLGLVRVPGGQAIGAAAAPSPHVPGSATAP